MHTQHPPTEPPRDSWGQEEPGNNASRVVRASPVAIMPSISPNTQPVVETRGRCVRVCTTHRVGGGAGRRRGVGDRRRGAGRRGTRGRSTAVHAVHVACFRRITHAGTHRRTIRQYQGRRCRRCTVAALGRCGKLPEPTAATTSIKGHTEHRGHMTTETDQTPTWTLHTHTRMHDYTNFMHTQALKGVPTSDNIL